MEDAAAPTGRLFGSLWPRLSDGQYAESVELFQKRAKANGFDLAWLSGKTCLDAGCGSGRYAVAMAMHGAGSIEAVDVSKEGLDEARRRAQGFEQITFSEASVLALPFADETFDFVWSAGVIHHTPDMNAAIRELTRVLKPGGRLFLLVYGSGGLRWKAIKSLRPIFAQLGAPYASRAIDEAGFSANNHKHFMDDLFVPIQQLTRFDDLASSLHRAGLIAIERWEGPTFDHESDPESQVADIVKLEAIATSAIRNAESREEKHLAEIAGAISRAYVRQANAILADDELTELQRHHLVIGEGNHRVLATKAV